MTLSVDAAIGLSVLAPFFAGAVAPFLFRALGAWSGWLLALVPAAICGFLLTLIEPIARGESIVAALDWVPSIGLSLAFRIDGLSLMFALMISGIGALILAYSGGYLKGHPHQGRFLGYLCGFTGAMLGLVLVDNMVGLYLFWELTSVASFLLIGFDHRREKARRAATQALLVTGAGGLALLVAALLLQQIAGVWELSGLVATGLDLAAHPAYGLVLGLVLFAAFTKSAQFPFHFWLPNAMEAPTPVSAFLHSATMVQGGVYLLARLSPALGGSAAWTTLLMLFGGVTLIWGAVAALRQTDMKQMLAQTTIASLGLLVLLIGIGTETALLAMAAYFVAHALYKAALFLTVGVIDHGTGSRDVTVLGGLREPMAISFIAAALGAFSMLGLPPLLGFLAKEEMYLSLVGSDPAGLLALLALVLGNALMGAVGLALMLRPFWGPPRPLPHTPHEGSFTLLVGPVALGLLGLLAGFVVPWLGRGLFAPAASAIAGETYVNHLKLVIDPLALPFWLSVLTWLLAGVAFWRLDAVRAGLARLPSGSFDRAFDGLVFGLVRFAAAVTRLLHHGRLERYLVVVFAMLALALWVPLWVYDFWPALPAFPDFTPYEWTAIALAVLGLGTVLGARSRLFAILALGVQGIAVALIFMLFGAPDLAFTQFMIEVLSVVILTLVMTRLDLERNDARPFEDLLRDGGLALLCGAGFTLLMLGVVNMPFDGRLSEFFARFSVPIAHGHNIVNVIIVDFRALDTLGEIAVVMAAGIAILALVRGGRRLAKNGRGAA